VQLALLERHFLEIRGVGELRQLGRIPPQARRGRLLPRPEDKQQRQRQHQRRAANPADQQLLPPLWVIVAVRQTAVVRGTWGGWHLRGGGEHGSACLSV